ncbi:TIR domain-containing protein [Sphingosinicella sp. LHD-64]|uniref:TIR domain-containing protein n=1 Tax=Sphingosinicella sp. LHD-64 TaxID=3072139 RepID=UPI00280E6A4B|nr:TIR domain-containing protein [Sphingosinicella sp. LHD-64]MDQ8757099.1 TIR domain-containing protein [Sphingosinicella sp. LHD-64]
MTGHVFVSHGSEDSDDANALAAFIESKGAKAWIAPRDVRPGQDYSEQLQEAIETSIAFVVLVSEKANRSPYVRAETEMAFSNGKPIFPVRMSDIQPAAGLAFFLKIRHWTDAFGPGRDASLARLAREVQTVAGVPVDAAPTTTPPDTAPPAAPAYVPPPPPSPPPAAPQAAPVPLMAAAAPPPADEALMRAAIGPNADLYLQRWRQMDEKRSAISWNWPACLLSGYWFAYRKMWLPLVLLVLASIVVSALGATNPGFSQASLFITIGFTFVTGTFGNHWYRNHVRRLIAETSVLPREAQLDALQKRGGVSQAAVFILIGLSLLMVAIGVIAAMSKLNQTLGNPPYSANGFQPLVDPNAPEPDPNAPPSGEKPPLTDEEIRALEQQGY